MCVTALIWDTENSCAGFSRWRCDRSKGVRGTFQKSLTWQFPTARGSKRVAFGKWCRPWLQLYLSLLLFREPQVFPRNQAYQQLYYSHPNDVGAVSRLFIAFRHGCCLGAKLLLVTGGSIRAYHTNTCHDSLRAETSMQRVEYTAIRLCCYWYSIFCLIPLLSICSSSNNLQLRYSYASAI